jgi:FMN phosphatase YigB (HAD superfamily)
MPTVPNKPRSDQQTRLAPWRLPLWQYAIFVDWNGVLSNEPFWSSILGNPRHHLYREINVACKHLFDEQNIHLVHAWMRGAVDASQIAEALSIQTRNRVQPSYLLRKLYRDCRRMNCNQELLSVLQDAKRSCFLVLATDNMDCFSDQVLQIDDVRRSFDAILSSSVIGTLKSDSIERFFGPWLNAHAIPFERALLLDDSPSTCTAFQQAGGFAIHVRTAAQAISELRDWRMDHLLG